MEVVGIIIGLDVHKHSIYVTELKEDGNINEQYEIVNSEDCWNKFKDRYLKHEPEIALEVSTSGKYVTGLLRDMPDYRQSTLEEIEYNFCTSIKDIEIMSVKRILEKVVYVRGSSGYGFPFTLKHLNFFNACISAVKELTELMKTFSEKGVIDTAALVVNHIKKVTENSAIVSMAGKLGDINSFIFQTIRKAFIIPKHGNL